MRGARVSPRRVRVSVVRPVVEIREGASGLNTLGLHSGQRREMACGELLTGNTDEDKLCGAYLYVFNGGTCEPAKIYRIIRGDDEAQIYRIIRGEDEDWGAPSRNKSVFKYMETLPEMRRLLTADKSMLAWTRPPSGEPNTAGVAGRGGGEGDLLDLVDDEGDNDAATAAF
jgi:hypothetical protein